jgi:hypothetical protein
MIIAKCVKGAYQDWAEYPVIVLYDYDRALLLLFSPLFTQMFRTVPCEFFRKMQSGVAMAPAIAAVMGQFACEPTTPEQLEADGYTRFISAYRETVQTLWLRVVSGLRPGVSFVRPDDGRADHSPQAEHKPMPAITPEQARELRRAKAKRTVKERPVDNGEKLDLEAIP